MLLLRNYTIWCLMFIFIVGNVSGDNNNGISMPNFLTLRNANKIISLEISFTVRSDDYFATYKIFSISKERRKRYLDSIIFDGKPFKFIPAIGNHGLECFTLAKITFLLENKDGKVETFSVYATDSYLFTEHITMMNAFYSKALAALLIDDIKRFPQTNNLTDSLSKIIICENENRKIIELNDYYEEYH